MATCAICGCPLEGAWRLVLSQGGVFPGSTKGVMHSFPSFTSTRMREIRLVGSVKGVYCEYSGSTLGAYWEHRGRKEERSVSLISSTTTTHPHSPPFSNQSSLLSCHPLSFSLYQIPTLRSPCCQATCKVLS